MQCKYEGKEQRGRKEGWDINRSNPKALLDTPVGAFRVEEDWEGAVAREIEGRQTWLDRRTVYIDAMRLLW